MAINKEGTEHSTFVIDANKIVCPFCGGTRMQLSNLMDDPNDIAEDTVFAALNITMGGGATDFIGLVALCHCGKTYCPIWFISDVGAFDGATECVGTELDCGTADVLIDHYLMILVGTDAGKYVEIASHTGVSPTTITTKWNVDTGADGLYMVTNIEPIGWTKITSN